MALAQLADSDLVELDPNARQRWSRISWSCSQATIHQPRLSTPACSTRVSASRVANSKRFLLRLDPRLFEALHRWADDDLRSINAQIEYLLTDKARRAGRLPQRNAGQHLP